MNQQDEDFRMWGPGCGVGERVGRGRRGVPSTERTLEGYYKVKVSGLF